MDVVERVLTPRSFRETPPVVKIDIDEAVAARLRREGAFTPNESSRVAGAAKDGGKNEGGESP